MRDALRSDPFLVVPLHASEERFLPIPGNRMASEPRYRETFLMDSLLYGGCTSIAHPLSVPVVRDCRIVPCCAASLLSMLMELAARLGSGLWALGRAVTAASESTGTGHAHQLPDARVAYCKCAQLPYSGS